MHQKLFFLRQISGPALGYRDPKSLADFKISNNLDVPGDEEEQLFSDNHKEYKVKRFGWPVYPFIGTDEELEAYMQSSVLEGKGSGVTVCSEIPPEYIAATNQPESNRVHLRINTPIGHINSLLDARVEWHKDRLVFPAGEITDRHSKNLVEMINKEKGLLGEAVVYDPGHILTFANLPQTKIYQNENGKMAVIQEIKGLILTESELTAVSPETQTEIKKIENIFQVERAYGPVTEKKRTPQAAEREKLFAERIRNFVIANDSIFRNNRKE